MQHGLEVDQTNISTKLANSRSKICNGCYKINICKLIIKGWGLKKELNLIIRKLII